MDKQTGLSPLLLGVLIVIVLILIFYNIWLDMMYECDKKYFNINKLMVACADGAARGCLVGGLLDGVDGAIYSSIAFGIVNPVMVSITDSVKSRIRC